METKGAIEYGACPLCHSNNITYDRSCEDALVSREVYEIWQCRDCDFLFTQSAPDEKHIGRYYQSDRYIAHVTKERGWMEHTSHFVRRWITLPRRRRWVERLNNGNRKTLLDIGCGTGEWLALMRKHDWSVFGTELDEDARRHCTDVLKVPVGGADALPKLPSASFNIITLWHVLEHVHRLHEVMEQVQRLLAPKGACMIAVPNSEAETARQYGTDWYPYDVPRHLYHFNMRTIDRLAAMHDMTVTSRRSQLLESYFFCLMSEKNLQQGSMLRGLWRAFLANRKVRREERRASALIFVLQHVGENPRNGAERRLH